MAARWTGGVRRSGWWWDGKSWYHCNLESTRTGEQKTASNNKTFKFRPDRATDCHNRQSNYCTLELRQRRRISLEKFVASFSWFKFMRRGGEKERDKAQFPREPRTLGDTLHPATRWMRVNVLIKPINGNMSVWRFRLVITIKLNVDFKQ